MENCAELSSVPWLWPGEMFEIDLGNLKFEQKSDATLCVLRKEQTWRSGAQEMFNQGLSKDLKARLYKPRLILSDSVVYDTRPSVTG